VETALAAQPALGDLLRRTLLGALDPDDEFHQQLVDTALAYFDQGQRHGTTAVALHVHPNTVRYRLSRLHELTGIPLEPATNRPPSTLEAQRWWWALRTWLDKASDH
jgi:DNA-binding PucR family transcriptional regulator